MADFTPGDIVVLKSGSMRMLVERIDGEDVAVVWANDGGIGRDTLPAFALNRWEDRGPREDRPARPPRAGGDRDDRPAKSFGDREDRPTKSYGDRPAKPFGDRGSKPFGDRGPKPFGDRPPKAGMDGKPRAKTFYRKDS